MASVTADRLAALQALDDQALVAYACDGDLDAFELLVERHHRGLHGFLSRRISDQALADDLAQEVFLDAFQHLHRCDRQRPFAAWLYRIAHNHVRMHHRSYWVRRVVSLEWLTESKATPPPVLWQSDASEPCLERELLSLTLSELSPPLREVLLLNCLDGFTALEIASILDISRPAAERRLSRAKQRFGESYTRLNGEAPC